MKRHRPAGSEGDLTHTLLESRFEFHVFLFERALSSLNSWCFLCLNGAVAGQLDFILLRIVPSFLWPHDVFSCFLLVRTRLHNGALLPLRHPCPIQGCKWLHHMFSKWENNFKCKKIASKKKWKKNEEEQMYPRFSEESSVAASEGEREARSKRKDPIKDTTSSVAYLCPGHHEIYFSMRMFITFGNANREGEKKVRALMKAVDRCKLFTLHW